MGFRRRTRRRAIIAGAAIAHHEDKKAGEQQQAYDEAPADDQQDQAPADDRRTRRNMRPLRRTRPTRSNTSHNCTPRARSQTKSSRRPRRKYSGPDRMPDYQKMLNRSIPGRNRGLT